ncbi:MAG TPA: sugar isomerase domain-containing protein [Actinobacteria bacterium]|nr:sugar isomerase domain-containing protein [Actinomycetota bacterium]
MTAAKTYLDAIEGLIRKIRDTQLGAIDEAAEHFAESIATGHVVHTFGSGHSVLPVMDLFPRYGAFVGIHPIMDARLMWTTPVGSGGAPEVLWQERQEGYIDVMLPAHKIELGDSILIFSHGGLNAAPVEMALSAKERSLVVVAVTSEENRIINSPTHSSGKCLADVADIVIDNCSPPEDALVPIEGTNGNVGASSTITAIAVAMALLTRTAESLAARGEMPERVFVSPNVPGIAADNNAIVYKDYIQRIHFR